MHQASVGFHCPDCVSRHARTNRKADRAVARAMGETRPVATLALIGVIWLIFFGDAALGANIVSGGASKGATHFGLFAPYVEFRGEWYRVVTAGFIHSGLMHVGFNTYLLYQLGSGLEKGLGAFKFLVIYFTGILGGSLGAVLIEPTALGVGASGAVFALMGTVLVLQKTAGINPFETGIGGLVLINILLSFRGGISLGGHLGGLAVGLIAGWVISRARDQKKLAEPITFGALLTLCGLICIALVPALSRAAMLSVTG